MIDRDEAAACLLATGNFDVVVGGASHGLSASLSTSHLLHIQRLLGTYSIPGV